jgi:hypothetical protein
MNSKRSNVIAFWNAHGSRTFLCEIGRELVASWQNCHWHTPKVSPAFSGASSPKGDEGPVNEHQLLCSGHYTRGVLELTEVVDPSLARPIYLGN